MVDSLADAAGAATTWTGPDGKVYKIRPVTIGDLAALEAWGRSEKIRSLLESTTDLDRDMRQAALVELCKSPPDMDGMAAGLSSMSGVRFLMWRSLRRSHPEITMEYVGDLVTMDNLDEVMTIIQTTGGSVEAADPQQAAKAPTP